MSLSVKRLMSFAAGVLSVFLLAVFWWFPVVVPVHLIGTTMGTYYSIKYIPEAASPVVTRIRVGIERELEKVNALMSTYRSDSEISRFNASRDVEASFAVSPEVMTVIHEAIRLHRMTEGGLDITVGPLVDVWGFAVEKTKGCVPSEKTLEERREWVGLDKLIVKEGMLHKNIPQLSLDLSAIAKGYTVDRIAFYLETAGVHRYMVDIGGEIRARGKNERGEIWQIAIEAPELTANGFQEVIGLDGEAIATSGNYRHYCEENGRRFSHMIDPRTGVPAQNHVMSISVLAASCMTADGLATGLGVLDPEHALRIADTLGIPVMLSVHTGRGMEKRYSAAFRERLDRPG